MESPRFDQPLDVHAPRRFLAPTKHTYPFTGRSWRRAERVVGTALSPGPLGRGSAGRPASKFYGHRTVTVHLGVISGQNCSPIVAKCMTTLPIAGQQTGQLVPIV